MRLKGATAKGASGVGPGAESSGSEPPASQAIKVRPTVSGEGPPSAAPPGGAGIGISSDNSAAKPPAAVSVPFGSSSATFSIPTLVVTASQTCTITATLGRSSATTQIAVIPALQLTIAGASLPSKPFNLTGGPNGVTGVDPMTAVIENKLRLREDVIDRINHVLAKQAVKSVYFTEFIVQ